MVLLEPTTQAGAFALSTAGLVRGTSTAALRDQHVHLFTIRAKFPRISSSRCWSIFSSCRYSKQCPSSIITGALDSTQQALSSVNQIDGSVNRTKSLSADSNSRPSQWLGKHAVVADGKMLQTHRLWQRLRIPRTATRIR